MKTDYRQDNGSRYPKTYIVGKKQQNLHLALRIIMIPAEPSKAPHTTPITVELPLVKSIEN